MMNKLNRYIRKLTRKADRYWTFEQVCQYLDHDNWVSEGEFFTCPQCGVSVFKNDWDAMDEIIPRCPYCREIIVEDEND